jgi:hypothetical protein
VERASTGVLPFVSAEIARLRINVFKFVLEEIDGVPGGTTICVAPRLYDVAWSFVSPP